MGLLSRFFSTPDERAQQLVDSTTVTPRERRMFADGFYSEGRKIGAKDEADGYTWKQYSYEELAILADTNWLARKIVRCLVESALKDELVFEDEDARKHWDEINYLDGNDDGAFMNAAILARTQGASLLILGSTHSGSPETPLREGTPIKFLQPVSVQDFDVLDEDINRDRNDAERYGRPDYFRITGGRFEGLKLHYSRVIHFAGPAPTTQTTIQEPDKLVGMSALAPVAEVIADFGLSWKSISSMLLQASVPVFKMKGLINGLAEDDEGIYDRLDLQTEMLSTERAVLLDADSTEEYRREPVNFADVPDLIKQLSVMVSASGDIPITKLFGSLFGGLGDASGGENDTWNEQLSSYQTRTLKPRINRIIPGVSWGFKPLDIPDPKTHVEIVSKWDTLGVLKFSELRAEAEQALTLKHLDKKELEELEGANEPPPEEDDGEEDEDPEQKDASEADEKSPSGKTDPPNGSDLPARGKKDEGEK